MKVQLFVPCFIDQMASEVGLATYEVLEKLGCEVIYPSHQTCCGQAGMNAGYAHEAHSVFSHFSKQFSHSIPIVTPGSSCAGFIDQFQNENERWNKLEVYELSYFLCHILKIDFSQLPLDDFAFDVGFHSSCSSLRERPQVSKDAITILKSIPKLNLIDTFTSSDECCGFGGSFSLKFDAIARAMAKRKLHCIQESQSITYLTSTDMSCLLHLNKTITSESLNIEIIHTAQILNRVIK